MKKIALSLFVVLTALTNVFAQNFEAECPSGQMLNFKIIDQENHYVEISTNTNIHGHLILPENVTYQNQDYTVKEIGAHAFDECQGITGSLIIPNTITSIKEFAFYYTGIEELTIGESVEMISDYAFASCSNISKVYFNAINCEIISYWISAQAGAELHIGPNVQRINDQTFSNCYWFQGQIDLPESLTYIGDYAFYDCYGFTGSLSIGDNVTYIGEGAFFQCYGLSGSLTIGNGVTTIGDLAFADCFYLSGPLTIGNSVTHIGSYAFSNCSELTGPLTIGNSVTSIDDYAFSDCLSLSGLLTLSDNLVTIGESAFYDCRNLTGSLDFGDHVTVIGANAFSSCQGLTGIIELPNSLTSIGNNAFSDCSISGTLNIPTSVTSIGTNPIAGCNNINAIIVEDGNPNYYSEGNTLIEKGSKKLISGIKNSQVPDDVKTIGDIAFYACTGLSEVTFGSQLTEIERNAFYNCTHLTTIHSNAVVPPLSDQQAFYNVPTYLTMTVPCGSFDAYWNDNTWSMFNNIIEQGNFEIKVISSNLTYGNAELIQAPSCDNGGQTIVSATAQPRYKFDSWTVDGVVVSRESTYTFTASEDLILVASFLPETGIDENDLVGIEIYPNPVKDQLHISAKDLCRIEILNGTGQILASIACNADETAIDMSHYTSGLYLIRIIGKDSVCKQIIKM